ETGLQKHALLQAFNLLNGALVMQPDASAEVARGVKVRVTDNADDAVYLDRPGQPVVEFFAAFSVRGLVVLAPRLDVHTLRHHFLGRFNADVDVLGEAVDQPK